LLATAVHCEAALYTFEDIAPATSAPFTTTVAGLSATFVGSASVCDSAGLFASLNGNVLIQGLCGTLTQTGPLSISFSSDIVSLSLNFATAGSASVLTLAAFENTTPVGTAAFNSIISPARFNGEGVVAFAGAFNRVTLTSANLLAIDNVNAVNVVPEPASMAMLMIGLAGLFFLRQRFSRSDAEQHG